MNKDKYWSTFTLCLVLLVTIGGFIYSVQAERATYPEDYEPEQIDYSERPTRAWGYE